MKKLALSVALLAILLSAVGVLPTKAQEPYTFEALLEIIKTKGATVKYETWSQGKVNISTMNGRSMSEKGSRCVAVVEWISIVAIDGLVGWPAGTVHSIGGLESGNRGGVQYQKILVDDSHCKSIGNGGSGRSMVPVATALFDMRNWLYFLIGLIALEVFSKGRFPIPLRQT